MNRLDFASSGLPPDEAFDSYRELYSGGSTVEPGGARFHASMIGLRRRRMLVFERHLSGVVHERDRRRVARDGLDHVTLQIVLSGSLAVEAGETRRRVAPGEIVLFDTTRPQKTATDGVHLLSVALGREMLSPRILRAGLAHGATLKGRDTAPLAAALHRLLPRSPENAGPGGIDAERLGHLLGATLLGEAGSRGRLAELRGYARLVAFVERHGGDRDLSVDAMARGSGLSRSALYRILEPEGGAAAFLIRWRLARLKRLLAARPERRTIATLARIAGFASPAHASRRFRSAFGLTPGEFRASRTDARTGLSLAPWIGELM